LRLAQKEGGAYQRTQKRYIQKVVEYQKAQDGIKSDRNAIALARMGFSAVLISSNWCRR
jgi:hypothetical protein